MPYLSKVALKTDKGSTGTLIDILLRDRGLAGQHRLLWTMFSDPDHADRDFLFRKCLGDGWLVLSRREPVDQHNIWNIETKTFSPSIQNGERLAFRLCASPSISMRNEAGKRVRHDAILHARLARKRPDGSLPPTHEILPSASYDWLSRKAEGAGFSVDRKDVLADCYVQHQFPKDDGGRVSFRSLEFRGFLTVANADLFLISVMSGFGCGKSYGFGLMLLSRA